MNLNRSVLIAMTMPDDSVQIMNLAVVARGDVLPSGAVWLKEPGWWLRDPVPSVIEDEINKLFTAGNRPVSWRRVEPGDLPSDRAYRPAWTDDGKRVVHDIGKAREWHRTLIRKMRAPAMAQLDGEFMRALGQGKKAEQDTVEAERQKWRDAPADPRIDAAQSVEELKQLTVEIHR
jgi:hypothetical protein